MAGRPYVLAETNWKQVKAAVYRVAVIPWGATEAHNFHLPYGTDSLAGDYVAAGAAAISVEMGGSPVVLPGIPYGINTGQMDIPLCMNLNPSTQLVILQDMIENVRRAGIFIFVILNGHGGNDFKPLIRELSGKYSDMLICSVDWWLASDPSLHFEDIGEHAGESETSVMLKLYPDWVLPLDQAGEGKARPFRLKAFGEKWAWTQRAWTQVTQDTGVGNPSAATAAKGADYLDACIKKIGAFLYELEKTPKELFYQ
ncbi:MAG: creatininase family protein [Bacteroidales bacterium]|nr:creatininase family protein [Bacteroidales bacterium]